VYLNLKYFICKGSCGSS